MPVLGIDLGGTKLSSAVFDETGQMLFQETIPLAERKGAAVGQLISRQVEKMISFPNRVNSIGICIPGIYYPGSGRAWVPNIEGWEDYPLLTEIKEAAGNIPVTVDSDRAAYIMGEVWQGKAYGCRDAIFVAVGTGIGAGIIVNGALLRGAHNIAGAIGWMALPALYKSARGNCDCFEYYASGTGIALLGRQLLGEQINYHGILRNKDIRSISARDVFDAFAENDPVATEVIHHCIDYWGMAVANLVSLFDPEKIIFGGGVFGPAAAYLPMIKAQATRWAQPISMQRVVIEATALGSDAGVYGAAFLALQSQQQKKAVNV